MSHPVDTIMLQKAGGCSESEQKSNEQSSANNEQIENSFHTLQESEISLTHTCSMSEQHKLAQNSEFESNNGKQTHLQSPSVRTHRLADSEQMQMQTANFTEQKSNEKIQSQLISVGSSFSHALNQIFKETIPQFTLSLSLQATSMQWQFHSNATKRHQSNTHSHPHGLTCNSIHDTRQSKKISSSINTCADSVIKLIWLHQHALLWLSHVKTGCHTTFFLFLHLIILSYIHTYIILLAIPF